MRWRGRRVGRRAGCGEEEGVAGEDEGGVTGEEEKWRFLRRGKERRCESES